LRDSVRRMSKRVIADQPIASINNVAVSPDGRTFAIDDADFSTRLWSHVLWRDEDGLTAEICHLVGSDLSDAEWERYAPGITPRAVCDG